jgi:hypothetical protein
MDPREFKRLKNNMLNGINNYSMYMEELGVLSEETTKRINSGEASWKERRGAQKRNERNDVSNMDLIWSNEDGKPVFISYDEEGNISDYFTETHMMDTNSYYDNRYKLNEDVEGFTKALQPWTATELTSKGQDITTDVRLNPDFQPTRNRIINTILGNGDPKRIGGGIRYRF